MDSKFIKKIIGKRLIDAINPLIIKIFCVKPRIVVFDFIYLLIYLFFTFKESKVSNKIMID